MSADPAKPSHCLYSFDRSGFYAFAWLAFGVTLVALLPSQLALGHPLWKVHLSRIEIALLLAAPLLAAPLADRQRDSGGAVRWLAALSINFAVYVPALLCLLLVAHGFSVLFVLVSMTVGSLVVLFPLLLGKPHIPKAAILAGFLLVALITVEVGLKNTSQLSIAAMSEGVNGPETITRAVPTELQTLRVTTYRGFVDAQVAGGGLAAMGQGYLAASGDGALFFFLRDEVAGSLTATRLKTSVPINHAQFFAETSQTESNMGGTRHVTMAPTWFRVVDLLVEEKDGVATVFAVHDHWNSAEKCVVLRVSVLRKPTQELISGGEAGDWETLYETTPCQQLTNEAQGGRLVRLPDGALLLSVGVHDDANGPDAQDPASDFGKTILIDVATKKSQSFTSGHRNPQGLTVSSTGEIWLTEHGPRGGDELNLLERGANFGWPAVSLGVPYFPGGPPNAGAAAGSHEGFVKPVYAWVPSIGISNLIEVNGELFPYWNHDLLIASLVRTALWRARIADHRVIYVEEIKLDERIRDLIQDPSGRLVLWTDKHSLVFIEPLKGGAEDEQLLASVTIAKCLACHVTADGTTHGIGPNLRNVFGRKVAGARGYQYSGALRRVDGTWDEELLDKFLANPQAFAPGMKMEMQAVPDATERRQAIEYLRSLN